MSWCVVGVSWDSLEKIRYLSWYGTIQCRYLHHPSQDFFHQFSISPHSNSIMAMSPADDVEVLNTIHHLLGGSVRVTMTDGRVATGIFTCLDRLGNIILEDVIEQRWLEYYDVWTATDDRWITERSLTKAVIIGSKVAKVEITRKQWEARKDQEDSSRGREGS